jgi:hypothetical protein
MLTHGSDCQRAGSGPFVDLVLSSLVQKLTGRVPADRSDDMSDAGGKRITPSGETPSLSHKTAHDLGNQAMPTPTEEPADSERGTEGQDGLSGLRDTVSSREVPQVKCKKWA